VGVGVGVVGVGVAGVAGGVGAGGEGEAAATGAAVGVGLGVVAAAGEAPGAAERTGGEKGCGPSLTQACHSRTSRREEDVHSRKVREFNLSTTNVHL
jgi:hypothetical protein